VFYNFIFFIKGEFNMNTIKSIVSVLPSALEAFLGVVDAGALIAQEVCSSAPARVISALLNNEIPPAVEIARAVKKVINLSKMLPKEASSLIRKIKSGQGNLTACQIALSHAANKEIYQQILAQELVYCNLRDGYLVPPSLSFDCPHYKVAKTIQFPKGLKALILTPLQGNEPPLVLFRGTDPKNYHNLIDDLGTSIGTINFSRYRMPLQKELATLASKFGRVVIAGHSYGGAMAQIVTAQFPRLITSCTTYNAPGVGDKVIQTFSQNIATLPTSLAPPKIASYRHAKDIVSLVGGSRLPCDKDSNYTYGTLHDPISYIDAHSARMKPDEKPVPRASLPASITTLALFIERCRQDLAHIIPFYRDIVKT
jgi:hypothetical protein